MPREPITDLGLDLDIGVSIEHPINVRVESFQPVIDKLSNMEGEMYDGFQRLKTMQDFIIGQEVDV